MGRVIRVAPGAELSGPDLEAVAAAARGARPVVFPTDTV
jgi:hypothetical protein